MKIESVLHCSDSDFGCAVLIDTWHEERGWHSPSNDKIHIGYHRVILNGRPYKREYTPVLDGMIEAGRCGDDRGAHVQGYNSMFGICMIGKDKFTMAQFMAVRALLKMREVPAKNIKGHYELDSKKTCPNIDMATFREYYVSGDLKLMIPWMKRKKNTDALIQL